jgi:hypothetical protein
VNWPLPSVATVTALLEAGTLLAYLSCKLCPLVINLLEAVEIEVGVEIEVEIEVEVEVVVKVEVVSVAGVVAGVEMAEATERPARPSSDKRRILKPPLR